MKKLIAVVLVLATLASCKTSKNVVTGQSAADAKTAKEIINGHYGNLKDFKTLYIKASARYQDAKQSQNVSAEIKIKKDEIILVSVRVMGFTLAKALITPTRVSYYEKLGSKYFDGDYALLSDWLGTDLDFNKVQNLLIGHPIDDLTKDNYKATLENGLHKLSSTRKGITKDFLFEAARFLLQHQAITREGAEPESVHIVYPSHKEYAKGLLPAEVKIEASQKDKVTIDIEYDSVTFDENLSFPYEVPKGYEQITIE